MKRRYEKTLVVMITVMSMAGMIAGAIFGLVSEQEPEVWLVWGLSKAVHGRIEVADVRFRLPREIRIEGLKLTLPGETRPIFAIPRADILFDWMTVLHGEPGIRRVKVSNPTFRLVGQTKRMNVADMVRKPEHKTLVKKRRSIEFERHILSEGMIGDRGVFTMSGRHLFKDDRERIITGIDTEWKRLGDGVEKWKFEGFVRENPFIGTTVSGQANFDTGELYFDIHIPRVMFTEELSDMIPIIGDKVRQDWQPSGLGAGRIYIFQESDDDPLNYHVIVDANNMKCRPKFMPLLCEKISGRIEVINDQILMKNLRGVIAKEGGILDLDLPDSGPLETPSESASARETMPSCITLNGRFDPKKSSGMLQISGDDITVTEPIIEAIPLIGKEVWQKYRPTGQVSFDSRILLSPPSGIPQSYTADVIVNDGGIVAEWFPIPITGMHGRMRFSEQGFPMVDIEGRACSGIINYTGSILTLTPGSTRFEGRVNVTKANLAELLKYTSSRDRNMSGYLTGSATIVGMSDKMETLDIIGRGEVTDGYIADIPGLLTVLSLLKFSIPKKEAFHSARAEFYTSNRVIHIQSLVINSPSVTLSGAGTVSFDHKINMELIAASPTETGGVPLLSEAFNFFVGGIQKALIRVRITGTLEEPEVRKEVFQPVKEGVEGVFGVLKSPFDKIAPGKGQDAEQPPK